MKNEKTPDKCRNWQIILGEYVLGTVDERDRARLERHLTRCESCRRQLAETEKMYRLLGGFELAQPGPFFAAKVAGAVRSESEARSTRAGASAETALGAFRRWMFRPAFVGAAAAAGVAVVAGVLYVKVWLPRAAPEAAIPVAGGISETKSDLNATPREKEAAPTEKAPRGEAAKREEEGGKAGPGRPGIRPAEELSDADVAAYTGAIAEEAARDDKKIARAEERPAAELIKPTPERGTPAEAGSGRGDLTAAGKPPARTYLAREKAEVTAEEPYPTPASPAAGELGAAPPGARTIAGGGAGAAGRGAGVSAFGRLTDEAATRRLTELESESLTKASVEAWMDARFEADVGRLTGEDGALVDYVTPNGYVMTYFYELPVEEQKTLLSRLRREAEAATAAELLYSH
jgi:hypothetical protein